MRERLICLRCDRNPRAIGSSMCETCKEAVISGKPIPKLPPPKPVAIDPPVKTKPEKTHKSQRKAEDDGYARQWREKHPEPPGCFLCRGTRRFIPDGPLCDPCRQNLSNFLVWLGRKPLPERTPE